MPRTATIGPDIYEHVNALMAEGKSRTEAFQQVGEDRGSRPGTVAANYYRVARSQGQTSSRRGRRRATSRRGARSTAASSPRRTRVTRGATTHDGDIGEIAQQIAELTQQLVRQVQERDEQ